MRAVAPLKKNGGHVSGSVGGSYRKQWLHHQFVVAKLFCGTPSKASHSLMTECTVHQPPSQLHRV